MLLLNPRRTRTNMKLLQLVWIFLLTLCGQSGITAMTVKEDDDVILDCSFGDINIENGAFDWKKDVDKSNDDVFWYSGGTTDPGKEFRGRVSHFPDQLRFGNASIKIEKAKPSDSGNYTCYHATVKKEIKSNISLTVDPILKPRPEIEGAAPQPYVSLDKSNDGVLLQCAVRGAFPIPEVEWWDSDGNNLHADKPVITERKGNKYDVFLNVTVTKAGYYRCVATQKEINHQVYSKTHVPGSGGASEPSVTNLGKTKDGVLLQCVVRGASPELKVFWTDKSGNLVPSKEPQKTENSIILQTTVTETDFYRCVTTEGKKDDELYSETHVVVPEEKSSIVVPVVIAVLVAVLVTAVVVGVLAFVIVRRSKFNTGDSTTDGSILKNESQAPLKQDV